jgi:hypothetical protein
MLKYTALAVSLAPTVSAGNLRSVQTQPVKHDDRKLIRDSDRQKYCFRDGWNQGKSNPHDADFYENPFFRNNVSLSVTMLDT